MLDRDASPVWPLYAAMVAPFALVGGAFWLLTGNLGWIEIAFAVGLVVCLVFVFAWGALRLAFWMTPEYRAISDRETREAILERLPEHLSLRARLCVLLCVVILFVLVPLLLLFVRGWLRSGNPSTTTVLSLAAITSVPMGIIAIALRNVRRAAWGALRETGVTICPQCGYDCRATIVARCPECGAPV